MQFLGQLSDYQFLGRGYILWSFQLKVTLFFYLDRYLNLLEIRTTIHATKIL